jgi:cellulose synthase/poly-beta-1,6-N-acetylglucosamine synthase-like glycosyltransferase
MQHDYPSAANIAPENNLSGAINDHPIISAVVIGRNEGARLLRCLESVAAMDSPGGPVEIIYVDTASVDGSAERARNFGAKVIEVNPARPCAAVGRNAGWRAACASIVLFLDGDTILAPDFVAPAMSQFDDPKIAVVFGDRREIDTKGSIYNRVLDLDWNGPPGAVEFCGGDALVRRDVLEQAGGYDERLIAAEDTELCSRIRTLGYSIIHIDRQMAAHDLAITRFSQYWRRAVRTGYAYAEVSERFQPSDSPNWYRQARRNRMQGAAMLVIVAGAPLLSIALWSMIPTLAAIALIAALAVRTAMRTRWKGADLKTRLLHGLHSHLMQIPIFAGQMKYLRNRLLGRTERLIEYKDGGAPSRRSAPSAPP